MDIDYYDLLGVGTTATDEEIKKAYKKRAKELHPDTPTGSDVAFKQLVDAYGVLGNNDKRKDYDRRRNNSPASFTSRFSRVADVATHTAKKVVSDIVDEGIFDTLDRILGRKREPQNIETAIKITIEELYEGADKKITFKRKEACDACKGRGGASKDDVKVCIDCYGLGHVVNNLASLFAKEECKECKGTGRLILNKCQECNGKGECKFERELVFPIPKDLSLGTKKDKLIIPGEGEYGGNLFIDVDLKPHPHYEIKWPNLEIELPVKFYQAILGDNLEIDTLKGPAFFKLDIGTDHGDTITLKSYGLRYLDDLGNLQYGDLVIRLVINTPKRITKEQREILEAYKALEKGSRSKPRRAN